MEVADVDIGHFIENQEGKKEDSVTWENHELHQREEGDGIRQCDMEDNYNELYGMDLSTQWGGNNEATDKNEHDEENEDIHHESLAVSDRTLLELFIEAQNLTIGDDRDWMDMLCYMALDENGCHQNVSVNSRISGNVCH